jgi:hypothetical protein
MRGRRSRNPKRRIAHRERLLPKVKKQKKAKKLRKSRKAISNDYPESPVF